MDTVEISEDDLQNPTTHVEATTTPVKPNDSSVEATTTPPKTGDKKQKKPFKPTDENGDAKRRRRLTSDVWPSFDFITPDENGEARCKCKKCGKVFNASSRMGTGNMKRHILKCSNNRFKDIGQMILECGGSGGSLNSRVPDFNPSVFRELLATAIVRHDLPFQYVEYEGIRRCFTYLYPGVTVVARNTIKADIKNMYAIEKSKVKELLASIPGRVCLTSDCWTSITTDGYLSLTGHFIDSSWRLQKLILNFSFLPPPHSGIAMSNHVFGLLKDWGIQKKVFSITLDNASSNNVMVDFLKTEIDLLSEGVYFHVRCCAHIMSLIVQDGLKELDEALVKVRESVKYYKSSQARKQRFKDSAAHVELQSSRGLTQDVPTRWNSTYIMLDSVLYYKKAFIHLQKTDANYSRCPTSEEWGRIERIFKFLKVFYEVTCAFSGSKYPTTNLYFANVLTVRVLLHKEKNSHDKFMQKIADRMYIKFEKYWAEFSTVLAIAAVLDPRYKFQIVEWGYEKVYGVGYKSEVSMLKDKLFSLFNEYVDGSSLNRDTDGQPKSMTDSQKGLHDDLDGAAASSLMMDFDKFSNKVTSQSVKSELECYLEEKLMPRVNNFNILNYWKEHEIRYPTVARMARDILAVPISTVASESAFSTGGRVLDAYRSSLAPSVVEAIICLRDWVFGEARLESQLEELCGAIMTEKMDDQDENSTKSGSRSRVGGSESRVA